MQEIWLRKLQPNFDEFLKMARGIKESNRVHFFEILIDEEIKKNILENYCNEKNYPPVSYNRSFKDSEELYSNLDVVLAELSSSKNKETWKKYYKQLVDFYYKMGYSTVPFLEEILFFHRALFMRVKNPFSNDTAQLSRGKRSWAQEGKGIIKSWEDFEKFPWDRVKKSMILNCEEHLSFIGNVLPEGMKVVVFASLFEQIMEWLLGYEGLFYEIHDNPDLVESVFEKLGEIIYEYYNVVAPMEIVGIVMQADDLGFKTSTILSKDNLKKLVFPWLKKYSSIAHKYKKDFWYHCCGYKDDIIEDFIKDIKVDVLHSFEDICCKVTEYKEKYGDRIGIAGGVDIDRLTRFEESDLRIYVRGILDKCMPGGRYVLGSGNSIANYIPIKNYLIMLDEGLKWKS